MQITANELSFAELRRLKAEEVVAEMQYVEARRYGDLAAARSALAAWDSAASALINHIAACSAWDRVSC